MEKEIKQHLPLHKYYKQYLLEKNICKEISIEIEDLEDDIEGDSNNETLMGWFNWILDKRESDKSLKFYWLKTDDKVKGFCVVDFQGNSFRMKQEFCKPLSRMTDDDVIDMCIDKKDSSLTQESEIYFWDVEYKYAKTHNLN